MYACICIYIYICYRFALIYIYIYRDISIYIYTHYIYIYIYIYVYVYRTLLARPRRPPARPCARTTHTYREVNVFIMSSIIMMISISSSISCILFIIIIIISITIVIIIIVMITNYARKDSRQGLPWASPPASPTMLRKSSWSSWGEQCHNLDFLGFETGSGFSKR